MDASTPKAFRMRPESAVYAFFCLCFIALGVWAIESASAGVVPFGVLRVAVAWGIAAFLGLRMARLGVFIEANGIRVRNPLRTRRLPWTDIRGFTLSRSVLGEFGVVELHRGEAVRLWGIQPRKRVHVRRDRRAESAIGALNRELQLARAHGSSQSEQRQRAAQLAQGEPSAERT
jgi:hypothetical protein